MPNENSSVVDADHFKEVNDRHGDPAGDAALVHIADILRAGTRPGDRVCRLGGEEFAVFVTDTSTKTATRRADDLRRAVSDSTFTYDDNVVPLSVSIGAAVCSGFAEARPADLFRIADAALYAAKTAGRNRVVMADAIADECLVQGQRSPAGQRQVGIPIPDAIVI